MDINLNKGFTPSILKPEEAAKLSHVHSTEDQILDLSDSTRLEAELTTQQLDHVQAIKIGNRFVAIEPSELKNLVTTLRNQMLDGNKQLKETFNSVDFSEKTGITLHFSDFTRKSALDSMGKRAENRLKVQDIGELRRALKVDLAMLAKSFHKGEVPAKVLLQDMALLERNGLLSPDEKIQYQQILDRVVHQFEKGKGFELNKAAHALLKAVLERVVNDTTDIQLLSIDRNALKNLGTPETGGAQKQYQVVAANIDAVLAASDAAMHDLTASSREVGLTLYQQKKAAAKGETINDIELGRSQARVQAAIREADRQYTLIRNNMLPATQNQILDLQNRMDQRVLELVWQANPNLKGITDSEAIKVTLEKNPTLKADIDADPELNGLRIERDLALKQYKTLTTQMTVLGESKLEGLKQSQTLKQLKKEENTRVGVMHDMAGMLDAGVAKLTQLQNRLYGLQNSSFSDEDLSSVQGWIEDTKTDVQALSVSLAKQMEQLIGIVKSQKSTDPKELEVLETQLSALQELTYDQEFNSWEDIDKSVMGLKEKIDMLQSIRHTTLEALQQSNNVSAEEKDALVTLDKQVNDYSQTKMSVDGEILDSEAMIQAKIQAAEDETKDDAEKAFGFIEDLEKAESGETHGAKGHHSSRFGLAYGSHVSAQVDIFIGGKVGISGLAQAKVKAFIGAGIKVEKSFGQGPSYTVTVDVHAKIKGEATVLWIFKGSASIQKKLQAGLAFNGLNEVNEFRKQLALVVGLALDGEVRSDRFKRELNKLEDLVDKYSFVGSATDKELSAKIGLDKKHSPSAETSKKTTTETNDFGSINAGNQKTVTDSKTVYGLKVSDGHHEYNFKVLQQKSELKVENGKPVNKPPYTKTALQVALPPSVVRDAMKWGVNKIPPSVLNQLFDSFKAANPDIGMGIDAFKESLDKTLTALRAKFGAAVERVVQLAEKLHVEATFALEYVNKPGKERYVAVEIGIEKKWDTGEKTVAQIGGPLLSGEVGFQAQAEVEAGIYAKVLELEPEKVEH